VRKTAWHIGDDATGNRLGQPELLAIAAGQMLDLNVSKNGLVIAEIAEPLHAAVAALKRVDGLLQVFPCTAHPAQETGMICRLRAMSVMQGEMNRSQLKCDDLHRRRDGDLRQNCCALATNGVGRNWSASR
jgi:hypothetical protein